MRQRFKFLATLHAMTAALGFGPEDTQESAPQESTAHDEFHHPRSRANYTAGERHRKRLKAKRRVRNEMAFQSRRRNRA